MNNLRGAMLMVGSMGFFALEDMFIKLASETIPIGQILLVMGLVGMVFFAAVGAATGQAAFPPELLSPSMIARNLGEVIGAYCFVTALALTPISSASAILQALPLIITLFAALFLRESVGWRRWAAIVVGFAGMLLIVRPGSGSFEPASLFAVMAVLALAVRDLATRVSPIALSAAQISQWAYGMAIPLGAALLVFDEGPKPIAGAAVWYLTGVATVGIVGYYLIVVSLRMSDLSVIAPFRYSRLIFAMIVGIVVFGERPDHLTLAGAALIVASGLYALARERALFLRARQG